MMRKKYEPTERHLRKAWKLKKTGKTLKEIYSALKISRGVWETNKKLFKSYFAQQEKAEKLEVLKQRHGIRAGVSGKVKGANCKKGEQKLRPEDIDIELLKAYVICGFNRDKIASLFGISRRKLLMLQKESPVIEAVLTSAKEEVASQVLKDSLLRLCNVHTLPDIHFTSYQGDIYKEKYNKVIDPNLGAIKYLLANTIGWQSESRPIAPNNKGAILNMMDEIANHDDDVGPGKNIEDLDNPQNTPKEE